MDRSKPLTADPAKTQAWQRRSREKAAAKRTAAAGTSQATSDRWATGTTPNRDSSSLTGTATRTRWPASPGGTQGRGKGGRSRRNDGPWRDEVLAEYGASCRVCGDLNVQADHLIPRAQGGPSIVANGLVLCSEWSVVTPGGCHPAKTAHRLKIDRDWLEPGQIEWLEREGHAWWLADGSVAGRHFKLFRPYRSATEKTLVAR